MSEDWRQRVATAVKRGADQSTAAVPQPVRRLLRSLFGGERQTARLLRGLLWRRRLFVSLALAAYVLTALFEWSSLALFTAALETLGSQFDAGSGAAGNVATLGVIGPWLSDLETRWGSNGLFLALLAAGVMAQVLRSGLQFVGQVAAAFVIAWTEGDLRRRVFRQLVSMSYASTNAYKIGDLASYSDQATQVGTLVNALNNLIALSLIVLAYVLAMLWLSWPLTLMAVVALGLLSLSMGRVVRNIRTIARRFVRATVALNEFVVEYLSGLRVIHTFSRQEYAIRNVNEVVDQSVRARRLSLTWKSLVDPLTEAVAVVGIALFLLVGFWLVTNTELITVARLALFVYAVYRLLPRIATINGQLAGINNSLPYADRIAGILRRDDKAYTVSGPRPAPPLAQAITFDGVGLRYEPESPPAVQDLTFSLARGETVALVGPSGSGKSSIVNLLLRLYDPTVGEVRVDGVDLRQLQLAAWRRRVGVVDQDTFIFNDTVAGNIRFGRLEASDAEVEAAARIANAHEFVAQLAHGYQTEVGNRGFRLSGGQRQRLAIARAVLRDPDLLIFDEATSALDSHSERLVQEALERLRQGRTVIIVAHRLSTVVTADRILVLEQGRIVEQGTHDALLAAGGRYAAMWQLQAGGAAMSRAGGNG